MTKSSCVHICMQIFIIRYMHTLNIRLDPTPVCLGFLVDKIAPGQAFPLHCDHHIYSYVISVT